jgi:hypothetical protein
MTPRRTAAVLAALAALAAASGCAPDPAAREARVRSACEACHAFAPPEVLPREAWRPMIEHMAELAREPVPAIGPATEFDVEEAVAWYEARAPEALPPRRVQSRDGPAPLRFRRRAILLGPGSGAGVATVSRVGANVLPGLSPALAAPNMANGSLHLFSLFRGPRRIGEAGHPVRVVPADLDGDGRDELVVSDLGDTLPSDAPVGRVLAARARPDGSFALEVLVEGIGRVADARPADFDGDGDLDLVVAAFGLLRRGGVHLLHNEEPGRLRFRAERLSDRPGAVSVVPFERLAPDGPPGFAVAFAQHYESVVAFERGPDGRFRERELHRAPHPVWGTSHLAGVDLDQDGDLDFLLSHGDTLDDGIAIKPYHGVEWLENRGDGSFVHRSVGPLYGAHRAEAVDLDGDGDLDVVASGFLPQIQLPVPRGAERIDSILWFEHTPEGFVPWPIESNHPRHTGFTVVDLDEDGDPDVVAAINTAWDLKARESGSSLEVFFNEGRP